MTIKINKTYGEYLRDLRKNRKLTLKELGEQAGLSYSYLSQIERGERGIAGIPSPDVLKKLAGPLDISHMELMYEAGYISLDEINTNDAAVKQAQSIINFFKKLDNKKNEQGEISEELREGLRKIIEDGGFSDVTESSFFNKLDHVKNEIINKIKEGEPLENCLRENQSIFRIQYLFAQKFFTNSDINTSNPLARSIRYFINLLIGDRERDFLGKIEGEFKKRIGQVIEKYNVKPKSKIIISDKDGIRDDIPEQYANMILGVDNTQFHYEVLQTLQDIAHEFHIKWNSAYELGIRQPRAKKLEDIVQHGHITYKDAPLEDEDRQRILDMLKLLFPDRQDNPGDV